MNRVIKFRAWDGKEMHHEGSFCSNQAPVGFLMPADTFTVFPFDGIESGEIITGNGFEPVALMQSTGLIDKEDTEIYEGDVVRKDDETYLFYVEWNVQQTGFWLMTKWNTITDFPESLAGGIFRVADDRLGNGYYKRRDLQVIGNIYQHPELIPNQP